MTAFVSFVRTFAIWIYLLLAFGILFAIKMLIDAQHLSRTTLFSLDQERAAEQTYRAIALIGVLFITMVFVTGVNVLGTQLVPSESPILRGPTATLAPIMIPTNTRVPTVMPTLNLPTETPFAVGTPIAATATRTIRAALPTVPPASPALPFLVPAPTIAGPLPNGGTWTGEGQASAAITFKWSCDQCNLGSNDWYEVVITFVDKSGMPRTVAGRTQGKFLPLRRLLDGGGFEVYQKAKEDTFHWYVQVKREPGNQPLSPPSETWKFVWK